MVSGSWSLAVGALRYLGARRGELVGDDMVDGVSPVGGVAVRQCFWAVRPRRSGSACTRMAGVDRGEHVRGGLVGPATTTVRSGWGHGVDLVGVEAAQRVEAAAQD